MDISTIYNLRQKFTIIGITGQTGSGCFEIAEQLKIGFNNDTNVFPLPESLGFYNNDLRKYRIIHNFSKSHFKPFEIIYYKDILFAFILKHGLDDFIDFLETGNISGGLLKNEFSKTKLTTSSNFSIEIKKLKELELDFKTLQEQSKDLIVEKDKDETKLKKLYEYFNSSEFKKTSSRINEILSSESLIKRNKTLQIIANNLRSTGNPFNDDSKNISYIFTIVEIINDLIKAIRDKNDKENTEIVIDSLRNPFEIQFFRQRYSAYYTLAIVNASEKTLAELKLKIEEREFDDFSKLMNEEHSGSKLKEFYKQNVSFCIQNADIHMCFREIKDFSDYGKEKKQMTASQFSWGMQLLKYISLIDHPGIITPSSIERCMQVAYTSKYNSGCISRQVGSVITNENFAIKAVGWNDVPEGLVACNLRNITDLTNDSNDKDAFTPFEKNNINFRKIIDHNYDSELIRKHDNQINSRNICFCFKSIINSYKEGKNQVHTRSLHAEENAFLQLTKYGGQGIIGGKLFVTASPCELCSKKAYQLGINEIYYIDPYPGIAKEQILTAGSKDRNPFLNIYDGAIGNAYHWLYEPLLPYKDELDLILDQEITDLTKKLITQFDGIIAQLSEHGLEVDPETNTLVKI